MCDFSSFDMFKFSVESAVSMISNKYTRLAVVLVAPLGLVATPVFANTPKHAQSPDFQDAQATAIELIYPRYAQVGGEPIEPEPEYEMEEEEGEGPAGHEPEIEATDAQTAAFVTQIQQIGDICEAAPDEYQIGCYAAMYRELAADIPANGDYAEVKQILEDTARDLTSLTRANADKAKPRVRVSTTKNNGQTLTTPPITPVKPETMVPLRQAAANVMEEAETKLLRAASSDAKRAIHYQKIAAAVGSNKVLLRSA